MDIKEDAVHFYELSAPAREGIRLFLQGRNSDRCDFRWWSFENACAIWFHLKYAPDTPEVFPDGKSATLQRLEDLIADAIT